METDLPTLSRCRMNCLVFSQEFESSTWLEVGQVREHHRIQTNGHIKKRVGDWEQLVLNVLKLCCLMHARRCQNRFFSIR